MKKSKNFKSWIKSILIAIFILIIIAFLGILFKYYIFDSVTIHGTSMNPTFEDYDKVHITRYFRITGFTPKRGKIINFEEPLNNGKISNENPTAIYDYNSKLGFSFNFNNSSSRCIKRIIGLPGEHIELKEGKVFINGKSLDESYLEPNTTTNKSGILSDFTVPENTVFVLGDNREHSEDSREFGCIPFERIDGIAY